MQYPFEYHSMLSIDTQLCDWCCQRLNMNKENISSPYAVYFILLLFQIRYRTSRGLINRGQLELPLPCNGTFTTNTRRSVFVPLINASTLSQQPNLPSGNVL